MAEHINFYENLTEALLRLRRTVVLYDGEPYYLLTITNHKSDGIFRVYLQPFGGDRAKYGVFQSIADMHPQEHPALGIELDEWLKKNPTSGILRKHMNSPLFNRFRPFPLGMCVQGTRAYYVERQPNRKSEQGLIGTMMHQTLVTSSAEMRNAGFGDKIGIVSDEFRDCILGNHPTPKAALDGLLNPAYANEAMPFHRHFAFVRGPIDSLFLAYKTEVVGSLPNGDFSRIKLGKEQGHTKEVVADLKLFNDITM